MCEDPEWFDTSYFINTGIVEKKVSALVFYESSRTKEAHAEVESEEDGKPVVTEERPTPTNPAEARPTSTEEKWQKMMERFLRKLGKANEVQGKLLALQTKKMIVTLSFMEMTVNLVEQNTQIVQQLLSSASTSKESQSPQAILESTPVRPTKKMKDTTTTTTNQQTERESAELAPSALKKVKLERTKKN